MYLHGIALSPDLQRREKLLNCAAYMMEDRSPDDPWGALKRLMRAKSEQPVSDLMVAVAGSGLLAKGMGARILSSEALPEFVRRPVVDAMIRHFPNAVVREFRDRGLPHKLAGIDVDVITEQRPDPESRLTLSESRDRLGVPIARIDWKIDEDARATLMRMGWLLAREFPKIGLPPPTLEPWVLEERPQDGPIIDMAHTAGTTRMARDPRFGVVDEDCAVHGMDNLYIAGASVFPTVGHANLTLMIIAMALRLADHLKERLG
jgi:choline dehydrogenase-like flavoprotein